MSNSTNPTLLKRQLSSSPDEEIKKIMENRSPTPRDDIINRGSSTRLTPKEEEEEIEKLDKKQKQEILETRHKGVYTYKKSARNLQKKIEKIDDLILKSRDPSEINTLKQEKLELQHAKMRKDAAATSSIKGRSRKRSQSFGGKTKKKLRKKKRRKYKKTKNRKSSYKRRKSRRRKSRRRRIRRSKKGGKVHYHTSLTVNTSGRR